MPEPPIRTEIFFSSKVKLVEDSKAEEVRKLRTAQFELRAKNLGIVGEKLIAEKVAIWEGLWTTRQIGDDIGHDAWVLLDYATGADL